MRAFGIFSVVAAAASFLSPVVFAAPSPVKADVDVAAKAHIHARDVSLYPRLVDVDAKAKAHAGVAIRGLDECASILTDLKVNLGVHIDALNALSAETATKDTITIHLTAIVNVIVSATASIKALVGLGISCDVNVCAKLVAEILIALCGALSFVLSIVADVKILLDVIVSVAFGDCLCGLISAVILVVDGLLVVLVPLVVSLVSVLVSLKLTVVGTLLTIL